MKIINLQLFPAAQVSSLKSKVCDIILFGYNRKNKKIIIDRSTNPRFEIIRHINNITDRQRNILNKSLL